MGKYLKKFNSHAEYNAFTATTAFILPNVSLCVNEDDLHYNPLVRVSGVTLDKSELSIKEGDTETLVASVLPSNASNKNVVWSSSDESVATVDSNGVVSGVGVGSANITVTTEDGGYTAQCATSVKNYKVITYTATSKLRETTTNSSSGLHINSFTGTSGQRLTMLSHTFEDGVGTVTFNGDIATFGSQAFYACSGLTSIEIPDSVTSIGSQAFYVCSGLTSINIPSGVTTIGDNAFNSCTSLSSIVIPDSVTSIGSQAFRGCRSLSSCTIGSGVTSISNQAFCNCSGLTSINIPDSVTSIGNQAFYYCSSITSCTIGSGVTSIGNSAFMYCSGLTSIDIPDSVTSIGELAFANCRGLTTCTIGNGVETIGDKAFNSCSGLTTCTIGNGVTSIGDFVFYGCSGLTSIVIPDSVTSIGDLAFYNCNSLTSITSNATTAPTIMSGTFYYIKANGTLYVPVGSSGYDTWMQKVNYYLGIYNWTKVEQ